MNGGDLHFTYPFIFAALLEGEGGATFYKWTPH